MIFTWSTYGLNYDFLKLGHNLYKNIVMGWSDIYSGQGLCNIIKNNSLIYYIYQMNKFKMYLFSFILLMLLMVMMTMI